MSALAIHDTGFQETRQTRSKEGREWVTSGTRTCALPSLCDWKDGETYEAYVKRHCVNHNLGEFENAEDAERNLGVWCGFFYARYVQGNESLGTKASAGCLTRGCEKSQKGCSRDHKIVAHGEPCWEDAEYLFTDTFAASDLEMDTPWEGRNFTLLPVDEREESPIYKRFKKYVKTRGTQKTSWGKAKVTFELLHSYFILDNPYFRILTISKASTTARLQYFIPLKQLWSKNLNIKRLYGIWETRCKRCRRVFQTPEKPKECPDVNCVDNMARTGERRHVLTPQEEPQRIGLVTRGSFGRDVITARWIVNAEDSSAMTITTLMCAGIDSTIVGSRWDLVLFDDPHDRNNIKTPRLRQIVKDLHSELRKQLDALGRLVWLCTPWHIDDASAEIDELYADEFHIMYRPARWDDPDASTSTPLPVYYWQYDALGRPVWNEKRIRDEERRNDFSSQVLLQPRDPKSAIYDASDFEIIDVNSVPIEIRFGLGRDLTEQERELLRAEGVEQWAWNFVDSAGKAEQSDYGCDSAIVGERLSRFGIIYVTDIRSGQWNVTEELNEVWASIIRNRPISVEFELSAAHKKYVEPVFQQFTADKAKELKIPVSMPMIYENVSNDDGQEKRIEEMHPHIKSGRVKILSDAGTKEQIAKFVNQFVHYRSGKRDIADAASRILKHLTPPDEKEDDQSSEIAPDTPCGRVITPKPGSRSESRMCGIAYEYHKEQIAHLFVLPEPADDDSEVVATMPFANLMDRVAKHDEAQRRDAW